MTWNDLIAQIQDYGKNNPELLNEPAIFCEDDSDEYGTEIDAVSFDYKGDGETPMRIIITP